MPITQNGDVSLNWISAGTGPTLLLIHGAGGNSAVWWQQMEHFSKTHQVVTYDHRSFGRSSNPEGELRSEDLVTDALSVLDACGASNAVVVGQSLGGWTALRLALTAPERVSKLVLSCTMAGIAHPPAIDAIISSFAKMDERGPASIALGASIIRDNPAKAYLYEQINAFNAGLSPEASQGLLSPETLVPMEDLSLVNCPTLIISGQEDAIWPPRSIEGIAVKLPDGCFKVIGGCGHSPYFERPEAYNEVLETFITS